MGRSKDEMRQEIEFALSDTAAELKAAILQAGDRSVAALPEAFHILDRLNEIRFGILTEDIESLHEKIRSISFEIAGVCSSLAASQKAVSGYGTNTFRCHSDFELCFEQANSVPEKTLCYALLARCIVKG